MTFTRVEFEKGYLGVIKFQQNQMKTYLETLPARWLMRLPFWLGQTLLSLSRRVHTQRNLKDDHNVHWARILNFKLWILAEKRYELNLD